jgi:serine/threonine protein kinase
MADEWDALPGPVRDELLHHQQVDRLLARLAELRLLTHYQTSLIRSRKFHQLIFGDYRVRERLGAGAMGVVFKAVHLPSRRSVAIKVLLPEQARNPRGLCRFFAERRTIAQLQHPNIVRALDVGEVATPDPDTPVLYYFVMELVDGQNLEEYVQQHGSLLPSEACHLVHQVAAALAKAHEHQLVHRDIKPANILVTPQAEAKVLDFGLVRQFGNRQTEPGAVLGAVEFMAPEQARDSASVDIRADIFGLGSTLFWCLTGQVPYPSRGSDLIWDAICRQNQPPPSVSSLRPDIPAPLDAVVSRMMALQPDDRFPTPQAVMEALAPFLPDGRQVMTTNGEVPAQSERILIVSESQELTGACRGSLKPSGFVCAESALGKKAFEIAKSIVPDVIILDTDLSDVPAENLIRSLRERPPCPGLKLIVLTDAAAERVSQLLAAGADDCLAKPIDPDQLRSRVKTALKLKEAENQMAAALATPPPPVPIPAPPPPAAKTFWQRAFPWLGKSNRPASSS